MIAKIEPAPAAYNVVAAYKLPRTDYHRRTLRPRLESDMYRGALIRGIMLTFMQNANTMNNLLEMLQSTLGDGAIEALAGQMGGADRKSTEAATNGIISLLTSAMAKNASTPNGARSLVSALDRDHDGSVLDDVMGLIQGRPQVQNPKAVNGAGILNHLLGQGQTRSNSVEMISRMSGIDKSNIGSMMIKLAPLVLGALGKARQQDNMDTNSVTSLLQRSVKSAANERAEMGLIGKFLDRDGDGSVLDDIAGMGINAFLRRR